MTPEQIAKLEQTYQQQASGTQPQGAPGATQPDTMALEAIYQERIKSESDMQAVAEGAPPEGSTLGGLAESAWSVMSGMIAEPAAGLAGIATLAGTQNAKAAADVVEYVRSGMTYSPESEKGQEMMAGLGNLMQPVAETLEKVNRSLGDFAYDTTGSPAVAAAAYAVPDLLLSLAGVKGGKSVLNNTPSARKLRDAQGVMLKDDLYKYSADVADVKLDPKGNVVPDKDALTLLDSDMQPSSVAVITNSTPETKKLMGSMFQKWTASKGNDVYALSNKMSEDIGSSVAKRLGAMNQTRRQLGERLNNVVKNELSNVELNIDQPVGEFFGDLSRDFGIKPTIKGNGDLRVPSFTGSALEAKSMAPVRRLIEDTVLLTNQTRKGGTANAMLVHRLKKSLDEMIDASKASEAGISNSTHRRLMGLRKGLNDTLRGAPGEYGAINDQLSNVITGMEPFQKYIKGGLSWDDAKVSETIGSALKNLDSDAATARKLDVDISNLDKSSKSLGINFADDPRALVAFKKTIDSYFKVDTDQIARNAGKINVGGTAMNAGTSLAIGNVFGFAHDVNKLRAAGMAKKEAEALIRKKLQAKDKLKEILK